MAVARWIRLLSGALAAVLVSLLASSPMTSVATAATTPPPTPSASASVTPAPSATDKNASFGIGPSDGKKVDGRSFFNFLSSPGGQSTDHVSISNLSTQPLTLHVYSTDAVNAEDGAISYLPSTQKPSDAGTWLSLGSVDDLGRVTLAPGTNQIIPFTLRVPASASPGDHTAGLIVSLTSKIKNDKGQDVNFEQRVASRVYVRVSGEIVAKLAVDKLHASYSPGFVTNPMGKGSVKVTFRVRNTGNVILGGRQAVEVSGWYGGVKKAPALIDIPAMLPGGSRVVTAIVPRVLASFQLTVTARVTPMPPVNAVDPALAVASTSVSVWAVPWILPIIVVILIGGAGFWLWRRLRRPTPPPRRHTASKRPPTDRPRVPVSHGNR